MTDPSHTCTRAKRYRDAARRLSEAVDRAGEVDASPETVDAIQAVAERMTRVADAVRGGITRGRGQCGEASS